MNWAGTTHIKKYRDGFTIVELLVVIVVIGILAALTIVGFNGIQDRASAAGLQSDLTNSSKKLEAARVTSESGQYPSSTSDAGLVASAGITYTYTVDNSVNPPTYCLSASNSKGLSYFVTHATAPAVGSCGGSTCPSGQIGTYPDCYVEFSSSPVIGQVNFASVYGYTGIQPTRCPPGFVPVPGSTLFNKPNGFCAMKYEARQDAGNVPVSTATGTPWLSVSWDDATAYSANVASCTGCHLMSDSEWLVIAHNVIAQTNNWNGGIVGTGYVYSGHNDGSPNSALTASTSDSAGYTGTGQSSGSQRRTLSLSNGEVIWDLAGNANEWSSGSSSTQIGTSASAAWRQWNVITNGNALSPNPTPAYGTPSASSWTTSQGIGGLYASNSTSVYGSHIRGGRWGNGANAGIFTFVQGNGTNQPDAFVGFRVAR